MGKVVMEFETEYEVGDVVVFEKDDKIMVGIVEGYYIDHNCDQSFWFNIRTGRDNVYTYSNGGDIAEWDVLGVVSDDIKADVLKKLGEIKG